MSTFLASQKVPSGRRNNGTKSAKPLW